MSFVQTQLVAQARPTPPGRPAGPGQAMPVYQGVPNAPWDGAVRGIPNAPRPKTVTAHIDFPSNSKVVSAHSVKPWMNGEQELIREGQIMFVSRAVAAGKKDEFNDMTTEASMQHLNAIATRGFRQARSDLVAGRLPDGIRITADEFDALGEHNIMDYFGRREADIPPEEETLRMACKLCHIKHFKYLLPGTMMMHWNLKGGVNNISYGTSPESRMNTSTPRTVVVNHVVGKDVFLSNVWGDDKKLAEGSKFGLIVRRANGSRAETVGAPEIVPWADRDSDTPALCDRGYYDEWNCWQTGYYLPIGTCTELTGLNPAERKRRDAIGNGDKNPADVHDAMGSLPKVRAAWGV